MNEEIQIVSDERMRNLWNQIKTQANKMPDMDIRCDFFSEKKVVYHARWELPNGKFGFAYVEGANGKKTFQLIQDRCVLDSLGHVNMMTEYEASCGKYVIPFGLYQGKTVEEVPQWYKDRWGKRDKFEFNDDVIREFVEHCN